MMTSARTWLLGLAFAAIASDAHAEVVDQGTATGGDGVQVWAEPPRLRLHGTVGLAHGGRGTIATWPRGREEVAACSSDCLVFPVLDLGVDGSLSRLLGMGLRTRWTPRQWQDGVMGRRWDVVEVLLTPQINLPWPGTRLRDRLRPYLAFPIGPAWAFATRGWSRAVDEEWNSRTGLSVGATVGVEFYLKRRLGFVGEITCQERFMSADVVETPVAEPSARATERVTLRQRYLTISVGILLGLDGS